MNRAVRAGLFNRTICPFGIVVSIKADDPRLFAALESQLPAFPDAPPDARPALAYRVVRSGGGTAVVRDRRTVALAEDGPSAASPLVTDLQRMVARRVRGLTFVHAGVVAIDGRAVVLPGTSYAGKSTLVAALVAAGASYGSDEFAVIGSDGLVHPYARPIALRHPNVAHVPPHAAGALMSGPAPTGLILFTAFDPAQPVAFASVSRGETVLRLLQHCLAVRGRPADTMAALHALARTATAATTARGEADPFARELIERCRRSATDTTHGTPALKSGEISD